MCDYTAAHMHVCSHNMQTQECMSDLIMVAKAYKTWIVNLKLNSPTLCIACCNNLCCSSCQGPTALLEYHLLPPQIVLQVTVSQQCTHPVLHAASVEDKRKHAMLKEAWQFLHEEGHINQGILDGEPEPKPAGTIACYHPASRLLYEQCEGAYDTSNSADVLPTASKHILCHKPLALQSSQLEQ